MKIPLKAYWDLLVDYLQTQWLRVIVLAVLLFSGIGLQLLNPQIMRNFIDAATGIARSDVDIARANTSLRNSALLFMGFAIIQQVVTVTATYLSAVVGWNATNALRQDLASHCLHLDMSFHNAHKPGEMIERLDGDVASLTNFFSQFVIQLVGSTALLFGVLVLLYFENWRVGLAFTLFTGIALSIMARFRNIAVPHWRAVREAFAEMFGFLEERLAGTEDIRANGAKDYVMLRFYQLMRPVYQKELKAGWAMNIMINASTLSFAVGNAVAFALGAWLYQRGVFTLGTAYIISYYSGMLMHPIGRITRQMEDLQRATAGIGRIQELLTVKSRLVEVADGQQLVGSAPYALRFEDVSFAYNDIVSPLSSLEPDDQDRQTGDLMSHQEAREKAPVRQTVLHDVSFQLQPGAVLGLLGRTGSGKTTMTRLIFRLYDPDVGSIRLGSSCQDEELVAIDRLPLAVLRKSIGMVTQNIQLFNATVRDNLTFFNPSISDEVILRVIEELELGSWFESLPEGLDTELESGGSGLSAGEQQLLAFTRIFLQDPGLVILDEASSRLDPATEHLIEIAVERLVQHRTAIIIAHRLSTVQRADEIMILDEGRIQEYGERLTLLQDKDSRFYQLLQTGLEEVLV
ncbi:MAG: ABC transporter ATP-binding protein [Anaerolineae bacterium]|nr:ABC transporter ATP-binding protein [Anaerolineae bacterium]